MKVDRGVFMKKSYFLPFACSMALLAGCASKNESVSAKQELNETQKEANSTKKAETKKSEVNKTIKRTNITVNNFSDCPMSAPSEYKTIPYE